MTESTPPITIATTGSLAGPAPGGDVYCSFANLSDKGIVDFTQTDLLSARPDLKRFPSITYKVANVESVSDSPVGMVVLEAQGLMPPVAITCLDLSIAVDGLPVELGATFRVPLSKGFGIS